MTTISELSDRFVDEFAALDPVVASRSMGVGRDGIHLTDWSPAGTASMADLFRRTLTALTDIQPTDDAERLGAGFLADLAGARLALIESGESEMALSILHGPPAAARMLFDLMDASTPDDWAILTARIAAVPAALTGYRESLQAGLDRGRTAARRQALAVAAQCRTWAGGSDAGWFRRFATGGAGVATDPRLADLATAADRAYGELAEWLEHTYAPAATPTDGVGEERYQRWAHSMLGIEQLDLDEAYEWGWDELARLEAEKSAECGRILPGASFEEVRELLATDPARSIDGVDAYREWLQGITDEALHALGGTEFDIPEPLRRCEVRIPPEGSAAAPYYTPPTEDLRTPGRTWFPTVGRTRFPTWDQVTTAYHEAVPGHHLQIGLTRLLPLTRTHRLGFNSAHGEGWALYAERLMDELGWFTTPDTRLGFLSMQAFRAARVVVDIGLHTGRAIPAGHDGAGEPWTFERAIPFLERAGGMSTEFATSEVLRYLSWPTQATTYKLGERAWLAARTDAMQRQGASFDRARWHSTALSLGALGLDRLQAELAAR